MSFLQNYYLCIDDLRRPARIGINSYELLAPQDIVLNLHLRIDLSNDNDKDVPCYSYISHYISQLLLTEHTSLCEDLAYKIANWLFKDKRIIEAEIGIRKLNAVPNANVGVDMHFISNNTTV